MSDLKPDETATTNYCNDLLRRIESQQAKIAALEKQLRISKCCENIDCDRADCPLKENG